jgi:alanyl-tRNA synthetase/REP element-mobilizing transposase RayT
MTSHEIRQSFLDFFRSKQHTLVPSSSLLPDAPNLLFTNAGMNQFVPIFLGQKAPDVSRWAGAVPSMDTRAADTQKCIRAGGKHNDLEDVGLDTYHHTFFEMLGNWSFGDYFKAEAIAWAWELITEVWKFPRNRLYATVYQPGPGEPAAFDQEAHDHWARLFRAAGLDPQIHIRTGGKQDNFWMMGDTGPCGPCSELHVDLTPQGDTQGVLVNQGSAQCIEIWNLVFMQFNANPDGTFSPLPAKSVDTGMGFERVAGILQNTRGFTDFSRVISNYDTDIFRPIFDRLEQLSGRRYGATLPSAESPIPNGQAPSGDSQARTAEDIAFRVVADHIRTLSFAIADGIQPGNTDRNYVLRRILRRAVRYGRTLGFHEPFFYKLVAVLADTMGDVFPEIRAKQKHVEEVIRVEEEAFNKTLDRGIALFEEEVARLAAVAGPVSDSRQSGLGSAPAPGAAERALAVGPCGEETQSQESGLGSAPAPGAAERALAVGPCGGETRGQESGLGSAPAPGAAERALAVGPCGGETRGARYSKRRLPHFERPWGKYMVTFSTRNQRQLSDKERDIVLESILYAHRQRQYQLYAACVMPDHVHLLFEPQIQREDSEGTPVFWGLGSILHGIKSSTAHRINKAAHVTGVHVWEEESYDRLVRGDADLAEKFHYICRNPWDNGVVAMSEDYRWLWTPEAAVQEQVSGVSREGAGDGARGGRGPGKEGERGEEVSREGAGDGARGGRGPREWTADRTGRELSGAFVFKLYDEQGFPLDLTQLMARERGMTVDVEGFNRLMEEQKARARAAQKKSVIELSQIETSVPTVFMGYDQLETPAKVIEVVRVKDKTAVILDTSVCYAEMGGQVGDTGELEHGASRWRIANTQKSGDTWLHVLEGRSPKVEGRSAEVDVPAPGAEVVLRVDAARRQAIQRHHTVTHLLHWALQEVVSREASQKGSYVGPEKLTFDFNHAPLTPGQVADVERLVNERILENAGVTWTEVKYSHVKERKDVMQFFGDKYGEWVRVVQVGGRPTGLDGYSMELCGGTHARATGEIGLFRIVSETAIASGVRRIEAIAGLEAWRRAGEELAMLKTVAGRLATPLPDLDKKVENLLAHQRELEKQLKAMQQKEAAGAARSLLAQASTVNGIPLLIARFDADGDALQGLVNELKGQFPGVILLGGVANGAVALVASVSADFTGKVSAGKLIQQIAPVVGGKGGGKPDNARGGGKDASKLDEALAKARGLL